MRLSAQALLFLRIFYFFFILFSCVLLSSGSVDAAELEKGSVWEWNSATLESSQKEGLTDIVAVSVGRIHSLVLKKDGTVWAWGRNDYGQLGNGEIGGESAEPIQVKSSKGGYLTNIKALSAGEIHSLALKDDGTVWTWGAPMDGKTSTLTATQEKGLSDFFDITAIDTGGTHSIALKSDGSVFAWGANNFGQIGVGCTLYNCSKITSPRKVMDNAISVAAGCCHSLAVKTDGTVWGWGRLYDGQLGSILNRGSPEQPSPTQIPNISGIKSVWAKDFSSAALSEEGNVFEWGAGRAWPKDTNPRQIPGLTDVIAADVAHSNDLRVGIGIGLKKDGTVWQWNVKDLVAIQIPNLSNIGSISAGRYIPNLAAVSVGLDAPIQPFLDLPWDYEGKGLSFNEAALSINSYFDHEYPLLGSGLGESQETKNSVIFFRGGEKRQDLPYSSHDGYDYGRLAKANLGDPVLAAADGCASYSYSSAGGNTIKIDHGNYYQTRYLHLQDTPELITKETTSCVSVVEGQRIGLVGATGNVFPSGDTGAHIHFGVMEDKDRDGSFDDNIPDGVTDPFGWQSKDPDPWEIYSFLQNEIQKTGNRSYYLWNKKLDSLDATLTSNGGVFNTGRYTVEFPEDATDKDLNLNIQSSPIVEALGNLVSIGTTLDISAYDLLGNLVTSFQEFFNITVDFSSFDLTRYDIDTLSIYSSTDGVTWTKEPTTIDLLTQTATTQVDHLTHFALLAERIDTIDPTTTATASGQQGQPSWFRGDVTLTLNAEDNENGLGVDYTLYRIETQENPTDWTEYSSPLIFTTEGHHKIEFYSVDKDENVEEIKTIEFEIDKTPPEVAIDANPKEIWPPNGKMVDVTVTGFATDDNLFSKTLTVDDEYNLIEPPISDFGQTIQLEARREGSDKDGRIYTINILAEDKAGNITEQQTQVIVPHDQGEKKK